jgi:hypothetical protein
MMVTSGIDGRYQHHPFGIAPAVERIVHDHQFAIGQRESAWRIVSEKPQRLMMSDPSEERVGRNGTPMAPAMNRRVIW